MLRPFPPLIYSTAAVSRHGEPTRLSSDRSPGDGNPISVRVLHAAEAPGSYRRGELRARTFIARGVMEEREEAFVRYRIERAGYPDLVGVVGVLDLEATRVYPHEDTMPSAVAARRADIERAGAHLEPIILASIDPIDVEAGEARPLRRVHYGAEIHQVDAFETPPDLGDGTGYVVLDGHHRIAATRHHATVTGEPPAILAMVVDVATRGLFVEPQHRVLGGPRLDPEVLRDVGALSSYRRGERVPPGAVAIVTRDESVLVTPPESRRSGALARISSLTLQEDVLPLLDHWVEGYATREIDAYRELDAGAAGVAIMGDLTITDVVEAARDGVVLPEKTTCFNPKVAVGLVGVALPLAGAR